MEILNLVLELKLNTQEKNYLLAFLRVLQALDRPNRPRNILRFLSI